MHCSLFAGIIGVLAGGDVRAAVRIGNATRANYYNQQAAEQRAAQVASVNDIARMSGTATTTPAEQAPEVSSAHNQQLESCSQIYPNGEFAIARPTAGVGANGATTCVAVVELRGYQMGPGGSDAVLARANVAAGTTVNCNISEFPEYSYTIDAQNVVFPADAEPTTQDVINVMNQEQKRNAGLKIAAATLVGAIGGNIAGKNDAGKDNLMGTDKGKITGTVIGALGGAAIGVGGAYAGKVGGDMIMSTGINAAAGGVVGNIMAAGDSVLRIENCDFGGVDKNCLWGYFVKGDVLTPKTEDSDILCNKDGKCYRYFIDLEDGETVMRCKADYNECKEEINLVSISVKDSKKTLDDMIRKDFDELKAKNTPYYLNKDDENGTKKMGAYNSESHPFGIISGAKVAEGPRSPVMIEFGKDKVFGWKKQDWTDWKNANTGKNVVVYYRNADGELDGKVDGANLSDFYPMYIDPENGSIIDLGNKARMKSTLIGAGAGGAIGAFTAYQGAQSDIDERWVSAVREYKDSLQKFYCVTGSRFLSYYNDVVVIPNVSQ